MTQIIDDTWGLFDPSRRYIIRRNQIGDPILSIGICGVRKIITSLDYVTYEVWDIMFYGPYVKFRTFFNSFLNFYNFVISS
jgi:hypothetical protein